MGGPGLSAFGPQSGRALSRGKDAARPSRLRRLGPFGFRSLPRNSRLAMPLIIAGVRAVRSSRAACTRAKIAQEGPYRTDQRGRRRSRPKAIVQGSPHARGRIRSQGASRTDRSGKGLPGDDHQGFMAVQSHCARANTSAHKGSQRTRQLNLIVVHSTGPVLLSGVEPQEVAP